jgi:hypothetical protein
MLERDLHGTGNMAVKLAGRPRVLVFAHADEISFLVGQRHDDGDIALEALCSYRAARSHPARVLRYSEDGQLVTVGTGELIPREQPGDPMPSLRLTGGGAAPGDRVVLDYPLHASASGVITGKIDNAAGVVACVLALGALAQLGRTPAAWFIFTDEEEGPAGENATFARGARRLLRAVDLPADTLCLVVDDQATDPLRPIPQSAYFTEMESHCRGAIVHPQLCAQVRALSGALAERGVDLAENPGYVSRGDSPALIERFRNIIPLGYPAINSLYEHGVATTSLGSIRALALALACMTLAAGEEA